MIIKAKALLCHFNTTSHLCWQNLFFKAAVCYALWVNDFRPYPIGKRSLAGGTSIMVFKISGETLSFFYRVTFL